VVPPVDTRLSVVRRVRVCCADIPRSGHYAVLFGAALGAEVTVFSRSDAKKADALAMGAKRFVATTPGFEKDLKRDLDLIIVTASSAQLPLDELLSTLDIEKKLVFVGMPETGLSNVRSQTLSDNAVSIASSHLGNRSEMLRMLDLAAEKDVKPWISVMPMKDAAKAIKAVEDNSVRYRSVLTQVSDDVHSSSSTTNPSTCTSCLCCKLTTSGHRGLSVKIAASCTQCLHHQKLHCSVPSHSTV
jgi:D-arabinose 1-dehydrogenase-like Zn-dependent alcohol dehydrogenase